MILFPDLKSANRKISERLTGSASSYLMYLRAKDQSTAHLPHHSGAVPVKQLRH